MVRNRVLVPLIAAAALLVSAGYLFVVVPRAFLRPCGPCPDDGHEGHGGGSSPSPSPGPAAAGAGAGGLCLRVPFAVLGAISFVVGLLIGAASGFCYVWFEDEEEDEASGAAKKAGYVAIAADDPEAGAGDGGKN